MISSIKHGYRDFGSEVRHHFEVCFHFDALVPILKLNNHFLGYNSKLCQKPCKPNIACSTLVSQYEFCFFNWHILLPMEEFEMQWCTVYWTNINIADPYVWVGSGIHIFHGQDWTEVRKPSFTFQIMEEYLYTCLN